MGEKEEEPETGMEVLSYETVGSKMDQFADIVLCKRGNFLSFDVICE